LDGACIVKEITGREVPVVLDPTLLLTKSEWEQQIVNSNVKAPYILCYFLSHNIKHRTWVKRLSKIKGYKIIVLPFVTEDFYWGDGIEFKVGPQEFLGLIEGAEIVCTDSYHGVLFSLIFNKEFYSFLRFKDNDKLNQNSRIFNLLENLNIKSRIVDTNADDIYEDIDWLEINNKIEQRKAASIDFLVHALR